MRNRELETGSNTAMQRSLLRSCTRAGRSCSPGRARGNAVADKERAQAKAIEMQSSKSARKMPASHRARDVFPPARCNSSTYNTYVFFLPPRLLLGTLAESGVRIRFNFVARAGRQAGCRACTYHSRASPWTLSQSKFISTLHVPRLAPFV
jgi:hypothetical protein